MSTSFFIFVNIRRQHAGASKCVSFPQQPSDRRGAKLIVGAALRITNRLHLINSVLIMHVYFVNNKR